MILLDDCSTDNTVSVIKEYANKDKRIKLHQLLKNTGSAYIPRLKAIELSLGDWVLNLDADDYLEDTCLQSMHHRAIETQADHVIPQLIRVSEDKGIPTGWECPAHNFDFKMTLTGKEACMLTIGEWEIGGAGVLIRRENYFTAFKKYSNKNSNINADELLTRKLLLTATKVAFCNSKYYYRQNSNSITIKFSNKQFDILDTNLELRSLIHEYFANDFSHKKKMERQLWGGLQHCLLVFIKNRKKMTPIDRKNASNKIKYTWNNINWHLLDFNKIKTILLSSNFYLFYLLYWIKNAK